VRKYTILKYNKSARLRADQIRIILKGVPMKKNIFFLSLTALLALFLASAVTTALASDAISGKVLETMNSGGYSYALIDTGSAKIWVAVPETVIVKGQKITFNPGMVMRDFESKTLKRKFHEIVFSDGVAAENGAPEGNRTTFNKTAAVQLEKVKVAKATGPNAYTIAEVFRSAKRLDKKIVRVRGKVMKVSPNIMKKNWLHIQDGTGNLQQGTAELVVTSREIARPGDIVTASGKIAKDRDFGSNYKYKVIMEDATLEK
jgi:hypothetical protein